MLASSALRARVAAVLSFDRASSRLLSLEHAWKRPEAPFGSFIAASCWRLRHEIRGNTALLAAAVAASALVLLFFAIDTLRNDAGTFVAIVVMLALAVVLDSLWKRSRAHRQVGA
jgi:hypothetical protein